MNTDLLTRSQTTDEPTPAAAAPAGEIATTEELAALLGNWLGARQALRQAWRLPRVTAADFMKVVNDRQDDLKAVEDRLAQHLESAGIRP